MNRKSQPQNRRGAALIIVVVLLACLAVVASTVLPQMLRDRHENRLELVRTQSRQLLNDALRNAEVKRNADPEFTGATLTLGPDSQPFPGTFQVTTRLENDTFDAEIEYRNKQGKLLYTVNRQPQP